MVLLGTKNLKNSNGITHRADRLFSLTYLCLNISESC